MKIAVTFTALLLVLLPVMSLVMVGDGTIKGRLQVFVSYGLSLTAFLLCFLTIVVSVYSLSSDFKQKQLYTVLTKPIRRFELIAGKLLGVIILDMALLVFFSAIIYVITIFTPRFLGADDAEKTMLNNEFFTARAALVPPEADVTEEVELLYKKLETTQQLPDEVRDSKSARVNYKEALARRIKLSRRAAAPGQELVWELNSIRPLDANQSLFIRFKYDVSVNPPDLKVRSRWLVGDIRQLRYGQAPVTEIYFFDREDLIRSFYEIEVPADSVAEDGYLAVAFLNIPQLNNTVVIFPPKDGLEILYKADTFTANFVRAVLLIMLRLIFLACLGTMAASYLSFPVAILLCLVIFFTGTISGFVIESFDSLGGTLSSIYAYTVKPLVRLLPQFDRYSAGKFLVTGRLLSWSLLARVAAVLVGVKSLLLMLIAMLIFSRREVAKAVV